jgi:histidinol phosphatase-like enzyme
VSNLSLAAIKDFGNFFQSRSTCFHVEEANKNEFKEDPALLMSVLTRIR